MYTDDRFRTIPHRRRRALRHFVLAAVGLLRASSAVAAVAERFGDLPAGETALFAAGRALADAGRRVPAAHWLHRYPSGRFTVEAKERLAGFEGNRP